MDAYSEVDAIYFSIANKTAYAKYVAGKLLKGSYIGCPPYHCLLGPASFRLRQFHTAEHQVYNAFMAKAKTLPAEASLSELAIRMPSLDEARRGSPFSIFCGTTFCFSSGLLLILSSLPNLFHFHNTNLYFMSFWLLFVLLSTLLMTRFIQKRFFLAKAEDEHLILAIEALKEVLNDE